MVNIIQKKSIGIDIADQTIEVVELAKKGGKAEVSSLGRTLLEPGIVKGGRIKDEEKLVKAVKEAFSKAKPHPIVTKKLIFGLPESQAYIHIFELGPHNKKERDNLVLNEAQTSIPLKENDLLFSHKVLSEGKEKVEILIVGASKEMVQEWQQFFQKLKLEVEVFDIESLAIFRGLFSEPAKAPVCLVDIGKAATNIAIFDKVGLRYSHSINVAGDIFTKEIANTLKIKPEEAEKQKIKTGLSDKNSRIFPVLIKSLEPINKEIETLLNYFQEKNNQKVKEIVLVGGSSKLEGIADYFNTNLDLSVKVGKPVLLETKAPLEYMGAIGLALRGVDKKWSRKDPAISMKLQERKGRKTLFPKKIKPKRVPEKKGREELMPTLEGIEETSLPSIVDISRAKKLRSKKILLIIILIIGVIVIGLAYWYRSYEKAQREGKKESQIVQYTKTQSFDLKVPVAVAPSEYTSDRARGRIIENTIKAAGDYNEAVAHSRIAVEKGLKEGEKLWLRPVSPEQAVFPMIIKWLVFSEEDANKLFLKEVDKLNKDKVDYVLNNLEKKNIESTENSNIFYLAGKVTISLNQLIEAEEEQGEILEIEETKEETTEATTSVLIEETGIGWLRVRKGPGTDYSEITKVYPGESYQLLEESEGWYKIKLDEEAEGWIAARYAKKE